MKKFLYDHYIFLILLTLSVILHILLLGHVDFISDNSTYAFRSLGWTDYFDPAQQGPIQWLGHTTWWSGLSFQDAPPLVFLAEFVSFKMFGNSTSSAQIPFLLSGVLILVLIYYFVKGIKGIETALWSSGAFAVSSMALMLSGGGMLEGVVVLFVVLSFFTTVLYLKTGDNNYLYLFALFSALSLVSKYTAIFVIPAFLFSLLLSKRIRPLKNYFKQNGKPLVVSALVFITVIVPVAVYNYHLLILRGRLDTALAAMLGMYNDLDRGPSFDFVQNIFSIIEIFFANSSFPFTLTGLLSFVVLAVRSQKKETDSFGDCLVAYTAFLFLMLGFMGDNIWWVSMAVPFLCMSFGLYVAEINRKYSIWKYLFTVVLLFELLYSINSNLVARPIGLEKVTYSQIRNGDFGFNNLDNYLKGTLNYDNKILIPHTEKEIFAISDNLKSYSNKEIIVYDGRISWFSRWWYFIKYEIYYRIPTYSSDDVGNRHILFPNNKLNYSLKSKNITIYFIEARNKKVMRPNFDKTSYDFMDPLTQYFISNSIPYVDITGGNESAAFRVYKIVFKE